MTTGPRRDREYDRFGPWVLEVSDEDPLPRLFVPYASRSEIPLLAIKIPRRIARRDAHPGMDLYDYVVRLYETEMEVLERIEGERAGAHSGGVHTRTFAYGDIRHFSLHEELLRGSLHLGVVGDPYTLPYNTVSQELMARVASIVRERLPIEPARVELPPAAEPAGLSFYFERLLRDEDRSGAGFRLLAAQPQVALGAVETSLARRLLFGLVDKRLLESIHLSDGHTLRVFDRGRPMAYRWQSVYGRRETVIPLANIGVVEPASDAGDETTTELIVRTGGGDCGWTFARHHPALPAYREWLTAASTRR